MRVGIVQFIKGRFSTGEERFFRRFPEIEYHVMGEGFTWETQDREREIRAAQSASETARRMLQDSQLHLIVLDELNLVLKYAYLQLEEVLSDLIMRRQCSTSSSPTAARGLS